MSSRPSEARLLPTLGLFTTITIVVGGMIGSGIFRNPSTMAAMVQSPELLLGVWVVAGLVSLFGALTNAEVAGLIPATGGQYQYFRTMYGDFTAYMYGWALFAVIQTGSIASISFVFSEYFATLFPLWELPPSTVQAFAVHLPFGTIYPLGSIGVKLLTCALVTLLTFINTVGVREGGRSDPVPCRCGLPFRRRLRDAYHGRRFRPAPCWKCAVPCAGDGDEQGVVVI
jgi:basic amino acid/polyamine antiporter, APA family